MGKILVIRGSDFSQNRIDKVDIMKQVKKTISTSYGSSTVSDNKPSLKNNNQ